MMKKHHATDLQMIPVDQIAVLNPRDRNGRVFEEIVGNIKSIGLKNRSRSPHATIWRTANASC